MSPATREARYLLMCCPLDRADVDPILVHIPQRRQFAQLADLALDQVDGEIDIFFSSETANRETDRAVRQFIAAAEGTQHIRWLQAGRGACRT